jgi:hypothetical protein
MLIPVLVRANYKVTTSQVVTLESLAGVNLPLLFPEVWLFNRTPTANSLTVSGQRTLVYLNTADPDFSGSVNQAMFSTFSIGNGQSSKLAGLENSLVPASYNITNTLTLTNAGAAPEAWVSLVLKGMIESSVRPDPLVIVNV